MPLPYTSGLVPATPPTTAGGAFQRMMEESMGSRLPPIGQIPWMDVERRGPNFMQQLARTGVKAGANYFAPGSGELAGAALFGEQPTMGGLASSMASLGGMMGGASNPLTESAYDPGGYFAGGIGLGGAPGGK